MDIRGKTAVITGASSGIGRALAVELGLRGARVVIAARSEAGLAQTSAILNAYGIANSRLPLDLMSEESVQEFLRRVTALCPAIDVFVNNAAVGLFESVAASAHQDMVSVFQTNFFAPLTLMQALVPVMRGGTLVNISSAAAKYAPFHQGMYAASKAALERVTEALSVEEQGRVRTLLVVPDRTATPFMDNVVGAKEHTGLGLKLKFATPEGVARRIAAALAKDKRICYTTAKSHLYTVLSAVAPGVVRGIIQKTSGQQVGK